MFNLSLARVPLTLLPLLSAAFLIAAPAATLGQEPIKIGIVSVITGASADVGFHCVSGGKLAIQEINDKGGITPQGETKARKIELVTADDQGRPDSGINAITKLIHSDKVFAFLGPDFSGVTAPSSYLSQEAKVPQLTSSMAYKITQQGNPWLLRLRPNDKVYAQTVVKFAVDELKLKKFALSNTNNELGLSGIREVEQMLREAYKLTPATKVSHGVGDRDLSASAAAIVQSGAEAVINWGLQTEAAILVRDLRNSGWKGMFIFQTADPIFMNLAKEYGEGVIGPQNCFHTAKDPKSQEFTARFEKAFGRDPTQHAALYYDGVYLLANAIREKGLDRDKVRAWLLTQAGWPGVSGVYQPAKLGGTGDMSLALIIGKIEKGQTIEIKRYGY
jgi:branched-chain amino acid transport system substrate-binding protein